MQVSGWVGGWVGEPTCRWGDLAGPLVASRALIHQHRLASPQILKNCHKGKTIVFNYYVEQECYPIRARAWPPPLGDSKCDKSKKQEGSHLEAGSWRTQRNGEKGWVDIAAGIDQQVGSMGTSEALEVCQSLKPSIERTRPSNQ